MYTIVGSGFGLYGYLPALVRYLNEKVSLPDSYLPKVLARPELSDCLGAISWTADRAASLLAADTAIVCLPPGLQARMCDELAEQANLDTIVLEKPVARTPAESASAYEKLIRHRKNVIIDYSFLYTPWFERLKTAVAGSARSRSVDMVWRFRSHHFEHDLPTWKRAAEEGGGPLRFYGIHVIALLAHLGYIDVAHSRLESSGLQRLAQWRARFLKADGPTIDVLVDTNADSAHFGWRSNPAGSSGPGLDLDDPFADVDQIPRHCAEDRRVRIVARMLRAPFEGDEAQAFYRRVNSLWSLVEDRTTTS